MPALRAGFLFALGLVVLAAALCACQERAPSSAKLTLRPATFGELDGWSDDNVAAAMPAFLKSCKAFAARADDQPLDPAASGDFGSVGEWRAVCEAAAKLPGTDAAAKDFFDDRLRAAARRQWRRQRGSVHRLLRDQAQRLAPPGRAVPDPALPPPARSQPPIRAPRSRTGALAGKRLELALGRRPGRRLLLWRSRARGGSG